MSKESEVLISDIKRLLSYVADDKHEEFSASLGEYTSKLCDYALSEFINTLKKDIQDNPIEYFETDSDSKSWYKYHTFTNVKTLHVYKRDTNILKNLLISSLGFTRIHNIKTAIKFNF